MAAKGFSLSEFGDLDYESLIHLANICEAAERHEDMCIVMGEFAKRKCNSGDNLTVGERNLLSVAYKNVVGTQRAAWRTAGSEDGDSLKHINDQYKKCIEKELKESCNEIIALLKDHLIPVASKDRETEEHVFYLKMCGDYYRYLAEVFTTEEANGKNAEKYYSEAMSIAEVTLDETHPARLGLALNMSVCYYEILKQQEKACNIAKSAFDNAIQRLDKMDDANYQDATLIMQLLRDNLTLWTSEDAENDED